MDDNRKQALAAALQQIERQFGKGAIMRMGDGTAANDIGVVSTGSLALDTALGIGGLPRGRVVEIYGPESSGKTTLTLHAIAECQKMGGTAAFVLHGARQLPLNSLDDALAMLQAAEGNVESAIDSPPSTSSGP